MFKMATITLEEEVRLERLVRSETRTNHEITSMIMGRLGKEIIRSGHQAETGLQEPLYSAPDPYKTRIFAAVNGALMGYKKEGEDYFLRNSEIPEEIKAAVRDYKCIEQEIEQHKHH